MRTRSTMLVALTAAALALGAGAPALAATAGSPNDRLTQKWYADFLGRSADEAMTASGRGYWVDRLDAKEEPRRLLEAILSSAEFAQDTVDGYYDRHLGRDSDRDPGSDYWKSGIRADMEPEWVEQNVLASPEYERRTGNRVENWYQAVLGRGANAGERAYWQGRAAAVGSLNAVREIWYAQEAVERRIRLAYADLLDRRGTSVGGGEIDYWFDRAADTDLGLRTDFALAREYGPAGSVTNPTSPNTGTPPTTPTPQQPQKPETPVGPVTQADWKAEVTITACTVEELTDSRDRRFSIAFTIKNTDPSDRYAYTVTAEYLDDRGNRIATDSLYTGRVEATQTRPITDAHVSDGLGTLSACRITRVVPQQ